ncbi:MAG: type II toxin-antitoxin system VapC family toxin [Symploca sp. SIO2G7]|nr:type II toxin-antitoxin system VapC family toxin [Symploca sp. SIO2G7]
MSVVDANIILRYLLDDHDDLSPKAAAILEQQTVTLPVEVACEVVYVLQKVYAVEREEIQQQLGNLLNENLIEMEKPAVFLKALECYGTSRFDFVDCLLWAYHTVEQQKVFTFDDKLRKHIQRTA